MAIYNEILAARFSRGLQKLLSMKGPAATRQLSGEVMPILPLFFGREARWLEAWDSFAAAVNRLAGGAGNFNQVRFRNPPNSGAIIVFERILAGGTLADSIQAIIFGQTADLTTVLGNPSGRLDGRTGNRASSMIFSAGVSAAALPVATMQSFFGANNNADLIVTDIQELPLLPGDALTIQWGVANQASQMYALWRERSLEDSEKQ